MLYQIQSTHPAQQSIHPAPMLEQSWLMLNLGMEN